MNKNLPTKTTEPKLYISTIDEFTPQRKNANAHSERGLGMLSQAMSEDGYVAPMTAAADGEVIDGSARLETAAEKFGDEVIVIEHDGRRPLVAKRIDIASADTEEAKRISLRANRIAEVDLSWDPEMLKQLDSEELLKGLWSEDELQRLFNESLNERVGTDQSGMLGEKWNILIECDNESQQAELLERLDSEGFKCRALIS